MNKEMTYTLVGADTDKFKKYDEICGIAFVNLFVLSKEGDIIGLAPFNPKNEEHLFLLGVAKGLASVLKKTVYVEVNKFQLWKLNRGLDKDCRFKQLKNRECCHAINPDEVLDYMRDAAKAACGKYFTFADIYRQYYARKKGK